MAVHFAFSDDSGKYERCRGESFNRRNPFFILSAVIICGDDWPLLRDGFTGLQEHYQLPTSIELKWSYIGSIMAHRKRGEAIPANRPYSVFSDYLTEDLISFVIGTINLLKKCEFCRIVYTVTNNKQVGEISRENLYKWHIQDIMQRTELELQSHDGLAVMFLDPQDVAGDSCLREAYATIYHEDAFIKTYSHIIDSLTFAHSHHSCGIRVADYVAGIFNGFLRGYSESTELFHRQVWPLLRKNSVGDPLGWGICEVPRDERVRGQIREKLEATGLLASGSGKQAMF